MGDSSEIKRSKAGISATDLEWHNPAAESERTQPEELMYRKRCVREYILLPTSKNLPDYLHWNRCR